MDGCYTGVYTSLCIEHLVLYGCISNTLMYVTLGGWLRIFMEHVYVVCNKMILKTKKKSYASSDKRNKIFINKIYTHMKERSLFMDILGFRRIFKNYCLHVYWEGNIKELCMYTTSFPIIKRYLHNPWPYMVMYYVWK